MSLSSPATHNGASSSADHHALTCAAILHPGDVTDSNSDSSSVAGDSIVVPLIEDHVVGSRLGRSIPRRRSWIPPWVVGLTVIVVLPLAVALAVFLPWHLTDIRPDQMLVERMRPTSCVVASTLVLDIKSIASNLMLVYLPGLEVYFVAERGSTGSRRHHADHYGDVVASTVETMTQAVRAIALPRLSRAHSWMSKEVADDYLRRHPINSTTACYYDPLNPAGRVVMRNGIDDLDRRVGYCLGAAVSVYVVVLFVTVVVAGPHLCY